MQQCLPLLLLLAVAAQAMKRKPSPVEELEDLDFQENAMEELDQQDFEEAAMEDLDTQEEQCRLHRQGCQYFEEAATGGSAQGRQGTASAGRAVPLPPPGLPGTPPGPPPATPEALPCRPQRDFEELLPLDEQALRVDIVNTILRCSTQDFRLVAAAVYRELNIPYEHMNFSGSLKHQTCVCHPVQHH